MTKLREQVTEFHRAFCAPVASKPQLISRERLQLRLRLIAEEFLELLEASGGAVSSLNIDDLIQQSIATLNAGEPDLVEITDALADLDYVIEGTRIEFGINGEPIADEVHRSNMAKVGGPVLPGGKIGKPQGWTPPDIEGCLRAQGWDGK